jgi:hypothetical protein
MAQILNHNRLIMKNPLLKTAGATSKTSFAAAELKQLSARQKLLRKSVPPSGPEGGINAWLENASATKR